MKRTPAVFAAFVSFAVVLIGALSFFVLSILAKYVPFPHIWIVFTAVPLVLLATNLVGNKFYTRLNGILYTISVFWVPILLYLFIGAIVIGIFSLFPIPHIVFEILVIILLIKIALSLIYGIWSALHPQIKTYTLNVPLLKEKWGDKKIVLFSDVHLGMVRHERWMKKIVGMVNDLQPDIVLIAGDLIDGPVFPYEQGLSPLKDMKSTYGIFYTAGNHDEYNQDQEKYYAALEKYVTVLNDKKVVVNDTQIVGVMFAAESIEATKERLLSTGYEKEIPSIVMLHDPKNVSALSESGVTLSLSGHTHAGQFFPFTLLVKSIYKNLTKGINYIGEMAQFTSVGVGTAGPVMRFGTTPEIVVIKIQ